MKTVEHSAHIYSTAIKSDCGRYRFVLSRIWAPTRPVGAFLCANPSKADELRYDDTAFKCDNMTANWSWGGFHVLNLYPNYSTDPNQVVHDSTADALNARWVVKLLQESPIVVVACGNGHQERLEQLIKEIPKSKIHCLRRNKGGGFQHPSRIQPEDLPTPVPAFESAA